MELLRARPARRPGAAARRRRRPADPDVRQGRPRRPAVAAAAGRPSRRPAGPDAAPMAWIAELWLDVLGADVTDAGRRLLRPRRRQPDRRADGLAAARALPRGGGRRRLRAPDGRRAWPPTSTSSAAGRCRPRTAAVPPTPLKTQAGQVVATAAAARAGRHRVADLARLALRRCSATSSAGRWLPTSPWLVAAPGRLLVFLTPPGRMLLAAAGARLLLRGVEPGRPPARRQGAPPALARRARGRRARRDRPRRRAVHDLVRPAARRQGRHATSTCTRIPPVTGMLRLGRAARSSPRSTSAATGSTATSCTSARSGSAPGPGSAPAACSAPGADVGEDAEVAPGSAVFGVVPERRVLVRLAAPSGSRARPRPVVGAADHAAARWTRRVRRVAVAAARLAAGRRGRSPGAAVPLLARRRRRRRTATVLRRSCPGCRCRRSSA